MKTSLAPAKLISLLALTSGLALAGIGAGCAATPTHDSTGEYIDDATITTKVKAALLGDGAVKSFQIDVNTLKGVVQLSGFVDNSDEKAAAGQDAANVHGVTGVQNHISVK